MDTKLDTIIEQNNQMLQLLLVAIPASKRAAVSRLRAETANTPDEVKEIRMKEMIRVHQVAGKYLHLSKKEKQRYPAVICQNDMEVVPRSVLLNRSAQSRIFAPNLEDGETSNMDNVVATLKDLEATDKYITVSLEDTALNDPRKGRMSRSICVFTYEQYLAIQKETVDEQVATEKAADERRVKREDAKKEKERKAAFVEPKPAIWKPLVEENLCWCGTPMEGNICPKCLKDSQR
jgi:hypothetical protein